MRKFLIALVLVVLGAVGVWAQWPGEKLKGDDLRASFRDALRIMAGIVENISNNDLVALHKERERVADQIKKELDGQFIRLLALLKNNQLDGLSIASLSEGDRKLLLSVLPPEAKQLASAEGVISGEGVISVFESLRERTRRQGEAFLKALESYRPNETQTRITLIENYGLFVTECGRSFPIIALLGNVSIAIK